jgi:DNA-binding CsgD family transcriptional regulator
MIGRDEDFVSCLQRAYHAHLERGESLRAARCAFWVGVNLATRGEMSLAMGWFGRAQRLVEREDRDCVERGYLMIPLLLQHTAEQNWEAASMVAGDAAEIGERFGDADLVTLAVHEQGHALVRQGRVDDGLRLVDEAMVAVTSGELSPIVTGLVYCNVIGYCQELYELRRAQEWTAALTQWCAQQPDMVAYTGQCLVHRAEIMQLHGAWGEALAEAERARERFAEGTKQAAGAHREGAAFYRQAEVHRLRGEFGEAEDAYRQASLCGWEPQPGLALLRLAQGDNEAATAAITRVLGETTEPLKRARLSLANVEIMLAVGDVAEARNTCRELETISAGYGSGMLGAMGAEAQGSVKLAEGDQRAALVSLRHALEAWQELEAPYEAARVRLLVAQACRALGDDDSAELELIAARGVFAELGAVPDVARADSLAGAPPSDAHRLSNRELEVLRLVAKGETNKAIAAGLVLSERTVDRHVSNIFAKLGVSTRAAATAYAYEHRLV